MSNRLVSSDDVLQHVGVKGMRWGVRRRSINTSSSSNRSNQSGNRRMSNKELTSRVKRLKLEQEYAKLTAKPETRSKMDMFVKGAGTVASLSGSALTIYKNMDELSRIISK